MSDSEELLDELKIVQGVLAAHDTAATQSLKIVDAACGVVWGPVARTFSAASLESLARVDEGLPAMCERYEELIWGAYLSLCEARRLLTEARDSGYPDVARVLMQHMCRLREESRTDTA